MNRSSDVLFLVQYAGPIFRNVSYASYSVGLFLMQLNNRMDTLQSGPTVYGISSSENGLNVSQCVQTLNARETQRPVNQRYLPQVFNRLGHFLWTLHCGLFALFDVIMAIHYRKLLIDVQLPPKMSIFLLFFFFSFTFLPFSCGLVQRLYMTKLKRKQLKCLHI